MPTSSLGGLSEEEIILQGGVKLENDPETPKNATREPANPEDEIEGQKLRGFARFLQTHSSPRHQRVTAGGRIVPAEPSCPPPTFHMAFLDEFIGPDSEGNMYQPYPIGQAGPNNRLSENNSTQHDSLRIHPALRPPVGFQVISASQDGTIAITCKGSTVIEARLGKDGETRLMLRPSAQFSTESLINAEPTPNNKALRETVFQSEKQHPSIHRETSQSHVLPAGDFISNAPILPGSQLGVSGFTRQPIQLIKDNQSAWPKSDRSKPTLKPQYSQTFPKSESGLPTARPLQVARNYYHPISDPHLSLLHSVKVKHKQKETELIGLERFIAMRGYFLTPDQVQEYARQKQALIIEIDELRRQREYLESVGWGIRPTQTQNEYRATVMPQPTEPEIGLYQQSHDPTNSQFTSREQVTQLDQGVSEPELLTSRVPDIPDNEKNGSARALSPMAPAFIPKQTPDPSEMERQQAINLKKLHKVARGEFNPKAMEEVEMMDTKYEDGTPLTPDTEFDHGFAADEATSKPLEGVKRTLDTDEQWADIEESLKKKLARKAHDPNCEQQKAVLASMPWTWAMLPGETKEMYEERLTKRYEADSQGRGSKPRIGLDNENKPFHAFGMVTKEPPHSATNALSANIRRETQRSSVSIRGGNAEYVNTFQPFGVQNPRSRRTVYPPYRQHSSRPLGPANFGLQQRQEAILNRVAPNIAVRRATHNESAFAYDGPRAYSSFK